LTNAGPRVILKSMLDQPVVDAVFHALGDPTRRRLLEQLSRGPRSVSELAAPLDVTLAAVVQHVQVLERCGLARTEKIGRVRTCHLDPRGLDLLQRWIADRRGAWERRFDRLGELLAEQAPPDPDPEPE
jgi:DNA-binding transcriptional ArsR family regulator